MDEVAGQLSQSKWEEIQKKKILLANEMRLAGKAMLDFPDRQSQIALRKQQLQLGVVSENGQQSTLTAGVSG